MLSKLFNKLIKKDKFLRRSQQKKNTRFQKVFRKLTKWFSGGGYLLRNILDALASLEPSAIDPIANIGALCQVSLFSQH